MSKPNKFQEELDVLALVNEEINTLQKEVGNLTNNIDSLADELKKFNNQRNIQWESVTSTESIKLIPSSEPNWDHLVNIARANQVRHANYSDFLTDAEIMNCFNTLQIIRKEISEQYSSKMTDELKDNFLQSLIGPFGLSLAMLRSFDGGSIPTVHNAKKGIIPGDSKGEKLADFNSKYDRKDYAPQNEMNKQRKDRFQNSEPIIDGYTGKELNRDGRSHIEHVISAKELHDDDWARLFLSPEKRKELINSEENLLWTDGSLNHSKNDHDLLEWIDRPSKKDPSKTNAEYFEINKEKAKEAYQTGQINKKKAVYTAVGKEIVVQCGKTSIKMGFRKALGYILYEVARDIFTETKTILQKKKQQTINLKDEFKSRFKKVVINMMGKWREVLKQFVDGAIAGFFSELVTFIINQFITTLKRIVRIIKEGFMSLVEMIRFVLNPPKNLLKEEIYQQVLKIGTTILVTSGGILLEEVIEKFLMGNVVTAPIATFLSPIITGLLTGLTLSIVMYGIDKFDIFGAKEKRVDQQISARIMDELWNIEKEIDGLV
jgi:hypothetical protein